MSGRGRYSSKKYNEVCNSFDNSDFSGIKAMVFCPHEDDEINLAGTLICRLTRNNAEVYLTYATNGDYKYNASTRKEEAVASAGILGVREDHVIFLGYGDSFHGRKNSHLFYAQNVPILSHSGHSETYGDDKHPDYRYMIEGYHHTYTAGHYLEDLVDVIERIRPNLLICSDLDEHPDHKMLSIYFDKAIGIILHRDPNYHPEVWKSFAYSLAYSAEADYSCINNPSTRRPRIGVTDKYNWDIIDTSLYIWDDRIRIPAIFDDVKQIQSHTISKALLKHKSQRIITHAASILNGDEVFWKRRTDGCSYNAVVTVSSGDSSYLTDYLVYNMDSVDESDKTFANYYWKPDSDDEEKIIQYSWDRMMPLQKVVIYGAMENGSKINSARLKLSDGYEKQIEAIPGNGNPVCIDVSGHIVSSLEVQITSCEGEEYGIAELEVYCSEVESCIGPFCKVMIKGEFAYEYLIDETTSVLPISLYSFGEKGPSNIHVVKGNATIENDLIHMDRNERKAIIRAEIPENGTWDQIVIRRMDASEMHVRAWYDACTKRYLDIQRHLRKVDRAKYLLKSKGMPFFFSKIFKKLQSNNRK